MKKNAYKAPSMEIIELIKTDIIQTSTAPQSLNKVGVNAGNVNYNEIPGAAPTETNNYAITQ